MTKRYAVDSDAVETKSIENVSELEVVERNGNVLTGLSVGNLMDKLVFNLDGEILYDVDGTPSVLL